MGERRVDRIVRILEARNGRAKLSEIRDELLRLENNSSVTSTSTYIAIQSENDRLAERGERPRFRTSRQGEHRGWVSLESSSQFVLGSLAQRLEHQVLEANKKVDEEIRSRLLKMEWRTFESTFLTAVLEKLGFEEVEITQATRDGGKDARVKYKRGIVEANAIVSAKRWSSAAAVSVDEVRLLRGVQGHEDTAIIVTTGRFTKDAVDEARPSQNQRVVYLVDGDRLVDICKRHGIGVKKVPLPDLFVLDEDEFSSPVEVDEEDDETVENGDSTTESRPSARRFRDEMLGDEDRGLSASEISELLGLQLGTVRVYLCDPDQTKSLGNRIRADASLRNNALEIVANKRGR